MLPLALLVVACTDSTPAPAPPVAAPLKAEPSSPAAIAPADLLSAPNVVLAPSPLESRLALEKAGLTLDITPLVKPRAYSLDGPNKDLVALRTGVLLADAVLTVKEGTDAEVAARIENVRKGLAGMGAGEGLLGTVDGMVGQVKNGGANRDELLRGMDDLVGMAVPGGGVGPQDRTGPLLQAGAWIESTHLAAQAVASSGNLAAADQLFRQAAVVEWFISYARASGPGRTNDDILNRVVATLEGLRDIAAKATLSAEDVTTIRDRTGELLAML